MARNRTDFTDGQRAELYRLDHATCSFTGRNLWILDYGIDPSYEIDWADHVIPAAKGGPSVIENGATACWSQNFARRDSDETRYLFKRGQPTPRYQLEVGGTAPMLRVQLQRFSNLCPSDWYLNRGLWHLWLACVTEHQSKSGKTRSRRKDYYTSASAKALEKWRRLLDRERSSPIEARGLAPSEPEIDQELMLSARALSNQSELSAVVEALLEPYSSSKQLMDMVTAAGTLSAVDCTREFISRHHQIPRRLVTRALHNLEQRQRNLAGASSST